MAPPLNESEKTIAPTPPTDADFVPAEAPKKLRLTRRQGARFWQVKLGSPCYIGRMEVNKNSFCTAREWICDGPNGGVKLGRKLFVNPFRRVLLPR